MNNNREIARQQLERLGDELTSDLSQLTDDALISETAEADGDPDKMIAKTKAVIESAIAEHGKRRLSSAREAYKEHLNRYNSGVVNLPLNRKRELIYQFASQDNELQGKLTMAARNEKDADADIDSFLEDLVELGVIDEEGSIK